MEQDLNSLTTNSGDGSGSEAPAKQPKPIIIKPPRVNLYGDMTLPNGKTVGEMFKGGAYKIPASAQEDPLITTRIVNGVEINGHTVEIDHVPASAHQARNMVEEENNAGSK